jgi:methylmalonyl-CoA mutase N-terminal domain/subunit
VKQTWAAAVEQRPERRQTFQTSSGIDLAPLYGPSIRAAKAHDDHVGYPGEYPFTRGVHATMYRGRLWTMRQYAGFASARATNERFRYLLEQGQTGLSVAFDLPTQIGYDSDDPRAEGEVGKVGVPINSLKDMELLLAEIPLDEVSLSMTINSTSLILLLMVVAVAKKQGVPPEKIRGTVQNDMLKEFVARNTYRFPLDAHLQLTTDLFRFAQANVPRFNCISVSGYHMREAGCTAAQEVAFTLANGVSYMEMAAEAGLDLNDFASRVSFFFASHNHLFEEVAKFRAARRLWASIMKERFGATDPRAMSLRFHTQTAGSTLTSKQPETNIVRVTLQALSAALGGTQSLHTNSWDEALGLPTQQSALLALRTQQVIAHESGVADVVDPLGGTPLVEEMTDAIEAHAREYLATIDEMGGAVEAVRSGWMTREIESAAYRAQQEIESGEQVVVGVNRYTMEDEDVDVLMVDQAQVDEVLGDLAALRKERDERKAKSALAALEISTAWGDADLPELLLTCVESYCTIGEICRCLESVLTRDEEV